MGLRNALVHEVFRFSRRYLPGRLYRVRDALFSALGLRIQTAVDIDGIYFHIDTNNYHERGIFSFGTYETGTRDFMRRYVARLTSGIVIDVGANVGLHTLTMAAARRGPAVSVLAFEANPDMVARLEANLALNGLSNVHVYALGLNDCAGVFELGLPYVAGQTSYHNPGIASMTSHARAVRTIPVACTTLDQALADNGFAPRDVRLIKLDIEGKELDVLRGAARVLKESGAALIIEYNRAIFDGISALLAEYGYERIGSLVRYGIEKQSLEENILFLTRRSDVAGVRP